MPRPDRKTITFSIDGREVEAHEGAMLVDAAKCGDVEIPVFCYEPKLGAPVGACRMCLVEIEGIPKLQAGCATPVKDGMVVHTQTDKVREAQNSVVEFLLVNHPLDCPVCDRGGECPLQDISYGWGRGRSRMVEPKRHFEKPLALSPLIAIDRERCILCYRCVRFSQEVSEDYQLVLQERGAESFVATFDGHPYVAPFSGNIIELCPVGALTSQPYRFRARPWDIEQSGSVCNLCPGQCNVSYTVRDDRVLRVLARDHSEVDDGWLCDRGRFGYQAMHVDERITAPMVRDGGVLREVSWERALDEAAKALGRAKGGVGAIAGGSTTNEEGFLLQRIVRDALGSPHIDSRASGTLPLGLHAALSAPATQATVPDVEFAHAVLVLDTELVDDMPILDLRVRKGVRRNGLKLAVATSRPSALDANAAATARFAPGAGEAFVAALDAALAGGEVAALAAAAGAGEDAVRALADLLRGAGEDIVIVWGERLTHGERGAHAARALLKVASRLNPTPHAGAGLLEVPAGANSRGLREVGVLPGIGPGLTAADDGLDTPGIAAAAAAGELPALYLLHIDPLRDLPDRATWEQALDRASTVIAHSAFLTEGVAEYATVIFPTEPPASKEGTLTHTDGRLQRMRQAIGHPGDSRAEWQVLAELSRRVGLDQQALTAPMVFGQITAAVPFYAGITLDAIGGTGVRWPVTAAASAWPAGDAAPIALEAPAAAASPNGKLRVGTFRSVWVAPEVEASPALKFLAPKQRAELAPADAERLGIGHGERVLVGGVPAIAHLRTGTPEGSVFLEEGIEAAPAAAITDPLAEVTKA
ncbi:MAG: NADH-quinone oxidoreductase subunit NuoG [Solirubrobacteraceae bacterium]